MAKRTPYVLELEVNFIELVAEALLCHFEKHSIIYSAQAGLIQAVIDAIEKDDLVVAYRPLIL
jgi:hypothetical protein